MPLTITEWPNSLKFQTTAGNARNTRELWVDVPHEDKACLEMIRDDEPSAIMYFTLDEWNTLDAFVRKNLDPSYPS